jgi:hypothetical protein
MLPDRFYGDGSAVTTVLLPDGLYLQKKMIQRNP